MAKYVPPSLRGKVYVPGKPRVPILTEKEFPPLTWSESRPPTKNNTGSWDVPIDIEHLKKIANNKVCNDKVQKVSSNVTLDEEEETCSSLSVGEIEGDTFVIIDDYYRRPVLGGEDEDDFYKDVTEYLSSSRN